MAAVRLESAFFFCTLTLCLSPSQSSLDSWGEGCRVDFTQNGHGSPHLLLVLQVDVIAELVVMYILGLAVVGMVLVVVVTVTLAEGNRAHKFTGLLALGGANLIASSFLTLDFSLFCLFSLDLLEIGLLFVNGLGFGWNRFFSSLFPPCRLLFSSVKTETVSYIYSRGCRFLF